jgi:glycosyltransferase involved in cell wall biosynthesis
VRAAIVGQGALRGALEQRAKLLRLEDSVEWLDWMETAGQVADLYRRARCLVCASYSEGGPRVVAEALACGTPVVSTPVGMAAELVKNDYNGFLVGWTAEAIAERLVCLLADEDLQRRLGEAAPEAVARFEKRRVVREYAEAYRAFS